MAALCSPNRHGPSLVGVTLLLTLLLSMGSVHATEAAPASAQAKPSEMPIGLMAAYFGELLAHPGLVVGAELHPIQRGGFTLVTGLDLGFYVHPRNHAGLFLTPTVAARYTGQSGISTSLVLGVGYLHTWADGTVYVPTEDGRAESIAFDAGWPHLMPSAGIDVGYDFRRRKVAPLRAFFRLEAFGEYPFNNAFLIHAASRLGVVWFIR